MNLEELGRVVDEQVATCKDVLLAKSREYSPDEDKLINFKASAAVQGCSPMEALAGYMAKHTISIYTMLRSGQPYTIDKWNEKITDHINYLLLLKGLLIEAQTQNEEQNA